MVVQRPCGSPFFAAAPLSEEASPSVTPETRASAVVISWRGKKGRGSTFINVMIQ